MRTATCASCLARLASVPAREGAAPTLTVDRDGRWFAVERGAPVDMGRRRVLRRILLALATRHGSAPGREIDAVDLLSAGWPGERVMPDAASRRVRTAVWELRRLGLGDVVVTRGFGYAIDPQARIVWV
jgi:hypothetical protein